MATTVEVMAAGLILLVNTFAIIVSFFVGNAILGPILKVVSVFPIHPTLQSSMQEISYIPGSFFGLLLVFEVLSIVGFVYVLGRRQVTPYDY